MNNKREAYRAARTRREIAERVRDHRRARFADATNAADSATDPDEKARWRLEALRCRGLLVESIHSVHSAVVAEAKAHEAWTAASARAAALRRGDALEFAP